MKLVKKGKANMILKASSKRRKTKEEIEAIRRNNEEEKMHIDTLKEAETILKSKNIKFTDIPQITQQNFEMLNYMRSKGIIDDSGQTKMN
jgi:uncharacterized membrane protein YgaE (UPF0421/DUF939 family)